MNDNGGPSYSEGMKAALDEYFAAQKAANDSSNRLSAAKRAVENVAWAYGIHSHKPTRIAFYGGSVVKISKDGIDATPVDFVDREELESR